MTRKYKKVILFSERCTKTKMIKLQLMSKKFFLNIFIIGRKEVANNSSL